ncbi:tail fiber domain-containing protein [Burkholderia cepacia]|uniref:tail fiber domain-containing protein n=1 Tax=Burkholderia cepacia TaxID=292 RepID=UPI00234A3BA8|nr:tail fiber domain-containing protein [Burkholderia cepacia]MDC6098886.1 tail fiber domain-containing protein [Burkholderia cepacia]
MNRNVDILNASVPLAYAVITDSTILSPTDVGSRFILGMALGKVITLPLASSVPRNSVVQLTNNGNPVVVAVQANDVTEIPFLNRGDWAAYVSDGAKYWHVLARGRMLPDETVGGNLTVSGSLSVPGGIAGDISASGKIGGVNSPNLLVNGSGELGNTGWVGATFGAVQGSYGEGSLFVNANAINTGTWVVDASNDIPCGPGVPLTLSAEIYSMGLNAGSVYVKCDAFKSDGTFIVSVAATTPITTKQGYVFRSSTAVTPGGTAFVRVNRAADNAPNIAAFGVAFRRIKLERNNGATLYSQEASIAYLGGAPAFAGRPTFAGRVPWDLGNLANPMDLDGAQTVTGLKTFTQRISITKDPVNGAYANAPVCLVAPTGMASFALASKNGASVVQLRCTSDTSTLEVVNGSSGAYQPITCYSVTQTSDARLKSDVQTITGALEKLRKLRGVYYVMNEVRGVGVIAQEVGEVFPEVVEELGVSAEDGTPYLGVNYANMVGPLLQGMLEIDAELQDAMKRIEALESAK